MKKIITFVVSLFLIVSLTPISLLAENNYDEPAEPVDPEEPYFVSDINSSYIRDINCGGVMAHIQIRIYGTITWNSNNDIRDYNLNYIVDNFTPSNGITRSISIAPNDNNNKIVVTIKLTRNLLDYYGEITLGV